MEQSSTTHIFWVLAVAQDPFKGLYEELVSNLTYTRNSIPVKWVLLFVTFLYVRKLSQEKGVHLDSMIRDACFLQENMVPLKGCDWLLWLDNEKL
jgi:hypothetical protein